MEETFQKNKDWWHISTSSQGQVNFWFQITDHATAWKSNISASFKLAVEQQAVNSG